MPEHGINVISKLSRRQVSVNRTFNSDAIIFHCLLPPGCRLRISSRFANEETAWKLEICLGENQSKLDLDCLFYNIGPPLIRSFKVSVTQ